MLSPASKPVVCLYFKQQAILNYLFTASRLCEKNRAPSFIQKQNMWVIFYSSGVEWPVYNIPDLVVFHHFLVVNTGWWQVIFSFWWWPFFEPSGNWSILLPVSGNDFAAARLCTVFPWLPQVWLQMDYPFPPPAAPVFSTPSVPTTL